jgi:membrane fusion protein (multidrug efflux system)
VQVARVIQRDVPVYVEAIGQTRGSQEVEVRARVEGILEGVHFTEGSYVTNGQRLYTIDPRETIAAVDQAKGRLAQAEADLARFQQDVARYRPLVDQDALPRERLETAMAQVNAAQANVEAARAQVGQAELNRSYTTVASPTDGIIGKSEVHVGNLVGRGQSTLLTTISKLDPIHLRFSISEREYLQFARRRQEVARSTRDGAAAATGQAPEDAAPFEMILADGSVHPHRGRLVFADRLVDPTTGTLLFDVAFPDPERIVRPGQYGRVRVVTDFRRDAILVPQKAVSELQATYSVMVVGPDNTIEQRQVQAGPRVGQLWVIDSGLQADDRVVVEGLQKVRSGMTVSPTMVEIPDPARAPDVAPAAGA